MFLRKFVFSRLRKLVDLPKFTLSINYTYFYIKKNLLRLNVNFFSKSAHFSPKLNKNSKPKQTQQQSMKLDRYAY